MPPTVWDLYAQYDDPTAPIVEGVHLPRVRALQAALVNILRNQKTRDWKGDTRRKLRATMDAAYGPADVEEDMADLEEICNDALAGVMGRPTPCTPARGPVRGPRRPREEEEEERRTYPIRGGGAIDYHEDTDTDDDDEDRPVETAAQLLLRVLSKRPVVAETKRVLRDLRHTRGKLAKSLARRPNQPAVRDVADALGEERRALQARLDAYVARYQRAAVETRATLTATRQRHRANGEIVFGTHRRLGWVFLRPRQARPSDIPLWAELLDVRARLHAANRQVGAPVERSDGSQLLLTPRPARRGLTPDDAPVLHATPSATATAVHGVPPQYRPAPPTVAQGMRLAADPFAGTAKRTLLAGVDDRRLAALVHLFATR